jgi:5-bromo-4-chloroindolyl phosphate hydrolysis protein
LYYCNAGGAYGSKGDRTQALHSYEAAQKLLKENLDEVGLTKDNIKFIDKTLSKFLENLKKLHAIQEDDPTFVSRVNNYGAVLNKSLDSGINNPKDAQGNTP